MSFANSAFNVIWHGTSVNVWFNYRYSFIVSFVLELIAFYSFIHVNGAKENLLSCGAVIGGCTVIIMNSLKGNVGVRTLLWDVLCICAVLVLLYMYISKFSDAKKGGRILYFVLIAFITLGNMVENAYLSLNGLSEMSAYTEAMNTEKTVSKIINDKGFYRRGSTWNYGRCYAMLVGYAGVNNYASTENLEALKACDRLGVEHEWMWCQYNNNIPFSTDALLGMKYIVTDSDHKSEYYKIKGQLQDKRLFIFENKNALPIIFPAEEHFASDGRDCNKIEYINNCWNSISPKGGDIFCKMDYVKEEVQTNQGRDIHIKFTASDGNPIYAFIPQGNISVDVAVYSPNQNIFYIGRYSNGEQGEVVIHVDSSYGDDNDIVLYSERQEVLTDKASRVLKYDIAIEKKSSSHLMFRYEAEKDGFLSSTIPFEKTWHVYIDGDEVETYKNMDSFLAFDCPKGIHQIELVYWPLHFRMGGIISVAAILIIVFMEIIRIQRERMVSIQI